MRTFQNYHCHKMYTNIRTPDSVARYEEYAKRAVNLGHGIISSVEHGWQSRYIEAYEMAKKYNLKFVFGVEAYWVKDRHEKDSTNAHIILVAKNENGRQWINEIISEANDTGYYYRPRVDLELLFSLPKDDVIVTTACLAFWQYEDIEDIAVRLHAHFTHFYLEVQYHNTYLQKDLNRRILKLSKTYQIPIIMGCDSHYIDESTAWERTDYLASKKIVYTQEEGWFIDYPDGDTAYDRFLKQGILSNTQISEAFENTNIFLTVQEYDSPIFNKEIKMITLYPHLTQKQRDKIYCDLIKEKWNEFKPTLPLEKHELYKSEIKKEVETVLVTKHADYFLFDYELVKRAVAKGGMITNSGRGSGVSFFTNKLLGFTKIDRIAAKVKMYPERFMSPTRILETKSLADLDLNLGNPEVFEEAQRELLIEVYGEVGKHFAYPMLAYGKFKAKSAWKMYARAKKIDFELANTVSLQIEQYEKALKYSDDDDKDDIDIFDYVEEKYHAYIHDSEKYLGIISDAKAHPCGHLLYMGNIRREIGLIKIKTESTGKERLCTIMDGLWAEDYKFLKNDLLKVDVVKLIKLVYQRASIKEHDEQDLIKECTGNQKVYEVYQKGFVMGINQVEKSATKHKVMNYKPQNISEVCAFVAAIRPGFKSMYSIFESRKPFSYHIPAFDKLIQTEEMPNSFLLYQEMAMAALNFAGIPMSECYEVVKNIAKKRTEKVKKYKDQFLKGFKQKLLETDNTSETSANEVAERVWQIIDDSSEYSFNASHSYSVAIDSLYGAYLKSHYPLHFYEVFLNLLDSKGNAKERITLVQKEAAKAYGIKFLPMRFGQDNRQFTLNEKTYSITTALSRIKEMSSKVAEDFYNLKNTSYDNFTDLWVELKTKTKCDQNQLKTLIKLNYFSKFGGNQKLLSLAEYAELRYKKSHTDVTKEKRIGEIKEYEKGLPDQKLSLAEQLVAETEAFGEPLSTYQCEENFGFVVDLDVKYTPKLKIYILSTGEIQEYKVYKNQFYCRQSAENPEEKPLIFKYDIINLIYTVNREKNTKVGENWVSTGVLEPYINRWELIQRFIKKETEGNNNE